MNWRWVIIGLWAFAATSGCGRNPRQDVYMDLLNAEKRTLEDRLYALEYDYKKALRQLEAYKAKAAAAEAAEKNGKPNRESGSRPEASPGSSDGLPKIELPPGLDDFPGSDQSGSGDGNKKPSVLKPDTARSTSAGISELNEIEVPADDSRLVESIHLNPRLTGGADFDQLPGDDGLTVLVEPRGTTGEFVPQAARVSIVVLDPALSGDVARIARWDFDRSTAQEFLQTGSLDRGLLFRVPWPEKAPENERLHLFVRYTTADGRRLEADREIRILPPDRFADNIPSRTKGGSSSAASPESAGETSVLVESTNSASPAPTATPRRTTATGRFWRPSR